VAASPYLSRRAPKRTKKYRDKPDGAISAPEHRTIIHQQTRNGVISEKAANKELARREGRAPKSYGKGGSLVNDPRKPLSPASRAVDSYLHFALGQINPLSANNIRSARQYKDRLMAGGSRREQVEAASGLLVVAGAIGGGPGKPKPSGPSKPLLRADDPAEKIIQSLPEAKKLRREQEVGYRAERAKRAAAAEEAMKAGGEGGYRAALAELKGELPKLKFGALEEFDQKAADQLFTHIQTSPSFRPFEKISAQSALRKVLDGQVPTRSDMRLLSKAFGPDVTQQIADSVSFWQKAKNVGLSVINIPRSVMASGDLSAPFRQGIVLGARHPRMFAQEFRPMLKAFRSETAYEDVMGEIGARPTFEIMQKAKLALTDLEGLSTREDAFMSNYAEKIPAVGNLVRASGRAYVAFLNKFRADAFDSYLRIAESQGVDVEDPRVLKSIAAWVNHATGRGTIKGLEAAMPALTAAFFSPRLIASRLQLLNPLFYAKLDPFARKQAVRGAAQLLGGISLTLWIAELAGADIVKDPRNTDFGKIKVGDTRVDITGGHQSYVVNAYRIIKGEYVSSVTGKATPLEGGFAKRSRADILSSFAQNKLAPVAAFGTNWLQGENFAGDDFDPLTEAGRSLLPLTGQGTYSGFRENPGAGAAALALGGLGFGVQTYGPKEKQARKSKPRKRTDRSVYVGGGSAGRSPYLTP
jgi:hypothetical protein